MKTKGAFISMRVAVLFLVMGISILFSYTESAAQPIELKLGFVTAASEGDPYFITSKKFGELVESYTKGKYKVKLFPSGQLGNESEMIKNLTMGAMDLGVITNAPTGAFVKPFMVFRTNRSRTRFWTARRGRWFFPDWKNSRSWGLQFPKAGSGT
jgi:TRAP-type C4-dicarboxylate transport system substrate-binding protein